MVMSSLNCFWNIIALSQRCGLTRPGGFLARSASNGLVRWWCYLFK